MSEWTDSRPGSTGRSQGSAECLTPPPQVLPMPQQQQQQGYSAGYGVPPQYQPPQYQQVQQQQQQQPQAGYAPQPQPQEYRRPQQHFSPNTAPHGNRQAEQMADPQETRTLLVVLRELSDSIELDQIYSIFSQFGVVEKLSAFLQHGKNQVVVQFNNSQAAHLAMGYLNGRELKLQGVKGPVTCTLAILPSRLKELTFKRDDNRNRDFAQTNANLERLVQAVRSGMPEGELAQLTQQMHLPTLYDFVWGNWVFGEGWLYPVQAEDARGRIPEIRQLPEGKLGDCVHISGLPTGSGPARRLNAVELWNVVGMYGELVAVKMLAQHPGCALLQFGSSEHANNCIKNMNYARLYGSKIFAQTSRNSNATHWRGAHTELEARMCTTQDKVAPAPAPVHLTGPPGLTIAAWGLPSDDNLALQVMTDLCMPHGAVYIASRGQGMATAQFLNTEAAFEAVSHLNNTNGVLNGFSYTVCLHFPTEEVTSYPVIASTGVASTPPCPSYSPANPPSTASTPPYLALGPQPVQQTPPGVAIAPHMSQQQQPQHQPQPQQQHQPPPAMAGRKMARNAWRVPPTASPAVHNAQPPMGQDGGMYGRGSQHTHAPYAPSSDAAWGASRTA